MIQQILIVAQGPNDVGFLRGLRDRLGCAAQLVDYTSGDKLLRQRGQFTRKKDAQLICSNYSHIDLIVRLTDGDIKQPQKVKREEQSRWPTEAQDILAFGVCDRDIEHWMCLDLDYAEKELEFDRAQLPNNREQKSSFIKNRIDKRRGNQDYTAFVADFVINAPPATVRRWLDNPAFSDFYDQCRAAAQRHDCEVKNLRDTEEAS